MRVLLGIAILAAALAAINPASGQGGIASVRVFADAPDARIFVDDQAVYGGATFLWPQGSKHILRTESVQVGVRLGTRYTFKNWSDSNGNTIQGGNLIVVTADPMIKHFQASFGIEFAITLAFHQCYGDEPCVSPAGKVYINGALFSAGAVVYAAAGSSVVVQATPNPGFVFAGWNNTLRNGQDAFLSTFTLSEPMVVSPRFVPARRIRIDSEPPGLKVLADRAPVLTPAALDWGWETTHTLGPISPQYDLNGKLWIFAGWTHGGEPVQAYTVAPGGFGETVTAKFVPGARATFLTSPPGLKLAIDGRENWQSYTFAWPVAELHALAAPLEQRDSSGRVYVFRNWSNGGPATQQISLDGSPDDLRLTANYELIGRLTLRSSPSAISLLVDGEECLTPCVVDRAAGAELSIASPPSVQVSEGTRLLFDSWSDGGSGERRFTFSQDAATLTVRYRSTHKLTAAFEPGNSARVRAEPASADGYYDENAEVWLTIEPAPGFRFRRWEGDLAGSARTGALRFTAPRFVRAIMDPVPYVPPAGVRNAAGDTPETAVAPGSIVSIFGTNLAPLTEVGPLDAMVQTLAGVAVSLGQRLLPLLFVSPEQINLQLPHDLEPGHYTLTIHPEHTPEVQVRVDVVRNAPGLFGRLEAGIILAMGSRADGSPLSRDNPARPGEVISLAGTGFGPYERRPIAGFAVAPGAVHTLLDPVEILAGDASYSPEFAGAAEGLAGVDVVRWRIPAEAAGPALTIRVRTGGRDSNPVTLFIE